MKTKFLKITLISISLFVLITSLIVSIMLGVSSTIGFSTKDNQENRERIYLTTKNMLDIVDEGEVTIRSYMTTSAIDGGAFVEDLAHCKYSNATLISDCTMRSILFDKDNKVIRTSYFPGDNYKYSVHANGDKTKTAYPNATLNNYGLSLFKGFYLSSSFLTYEHKEGEIEFDDCSLKFNWKELAFDKTISLTAFSNTASTKYSFEINSNDVVEEVKIDDLQSLKVTYDMKKIIFPDLKQFAE